MGVSSPTCCPVCSYPQNKSFRTRYLHTLFGLALRLLPPVPEEFPLAHLLNDQGDKSRLETELAQAVIDYLAEHPQAMDTLQGIAEWWVMRQKVRVDVEALARVLRQLTEQGILEQIGSEEDARYHLKEQPR